MSGPRPPALAPGDGPGPDPVSELVAGRPGSPTPSERREIYLTELRRGGPPPRWLAQRARMWGIDDTLVGRELAAARVELDASRKPEACAVMAHELTLQAAELGAEAERIAREPVERDTDAPLPVADRVSLMEARAKTQASRVRALTTTAQLKLKTAASYLAIHRKPAPSVVVQQGSGAQTSQPLGAALKQGITP